MLTVFMKGKPFSSIILDSFFFCYCSKSLSTLGLNVDFFINSFSLLLSLLCKHTHSLPSVLHYASVMLSTLNRLSYLWWIHTSLNLAHDRVRNHQILLCISVTVWHGSMESIKRYLGQSWIHTCYNILMKGLLRVQLVESSLSYTNFTSK